MFDIFEKYISAKTTLSAGQWSLIRSVCTERKITKGQYILREGEISANTNFVTKGLLRLFRTDHKGDVYILKFAHENRWISDRESYLTGNQSTANIEAMEDSEILTWEKADFDLLLTEIPVFRLVMKALSARSQVANQNRIYFSISMSAEEKYLQFMAKQPALYNRVPLHMIASYLGVSRETLSRVRRQVAGK